MDVTKMSRKDFEMLPHKKWNEELEFDALIILPGKANNKHDSGYRCMDFVAIKKNNPICLLSGCSDIIHIDGIGGFGNDWLRKYGSVPKMVIPSGWFIDCLPKSGLLRMWPSSGKMKCGITLSSFKIFALPNQTKEN